MKRGNTALVAAAVLAMMLSLGPTMFARDNGIAVQTSNYITGRVTSSGRPVPSVWVVMRQGGYEKGRSLTGDDGSYYIGNLGDGEYEIVLSRGAGQSLYRVTLPQNKVFNVTINF